MVSTVTLTAAEPEVTDLPLEDATRIDAAAGTVRIGPHVLDYLFTFGPEVTPGDNPPGSTLSAGAAAGATSLSVADVSVFADAYGWVKVGDQIVRYASQGASTLEGIPSLGFGALSAAVSSGAAVTWLGAIRLSDTGVIFSPSLAVGERVVQRVTLEDAAAQAIIAAIEGGDGRHEHVVTDNRLTVDGALARAARELAAFAADLTTVVWDTEDMNAKPGRLQTVTYGEVELAVPITRVELSFPVPNRRPLRRCEASSVRPSQVLDAILTSKG